MGPGVAKQQPLYSGAKVTSAPEAAATKAEELGPAHGGSNEDMKKVLMELDNTGYFDEVGRGVLFIFLNVKLRLKL